MHFEQKFINFKKCIKSASEVHQKRIRRLWKLPRGKIPAVCYFAPSQGQKHEPVQFTEVCDAQKIHLNPDKINGLKTLSPYDQVNSGTAQVVSTHYS